MSKLWLVMSKFLLVIWKLLHSDAAHVEIEKKKKLLSEVLFAIDGLTKSKTIFMLHG